MKNLLLKVKSTLSDGLVYILISGFFTQIIGFLSSIFVIRFLEKTDYGTYVSANNIYSYFTVFIGMGLAAAMLQFCSEKRSESEKNDIYCFVLKRGTVFNIVLFLIIVTFAIIKGRESIEVGKYLFFMAAIPFFSYFTSYYQILLRIKNYNKGYAVSGMINAIVVFAINLYFSRKIGALSMIFSQYIGNIASTGFSVFYLKKENSYDVSFEKAKKIAKNNEKKIVQYAFLTAITNFTSNILVLIDITCLDIFTQGNEILANYKVASVVPTAMLFISTSVIVYYYPKLIYLYSENIDKFLQELKLIRRMLVIVNGIIALGLFLFAPLVITLLFGSEYITSINVFRVLCLNYFIFGSYRKLYGNMIALIKKVKINLLNTTLSGVFNVILNIIFINKWGEIGAALATVCISIFTTAFSIIYFQSQMKKKNSYI